ncbi:MAG: pyridoxamine 5'-phosphate oxidase [Balneola sp.]|nr:pyridoxamine 5'-phosphate oxidase [Balneola sp.]MBO6649406.1 pyridoxamine 5'-phosphate oxidase [Balneola sp.]MBO6711221.1 pyridoxamine 5'-phosphate oxidase [Balneola sp.]MBO6800664.1 pyridoxamine 5'-phosphate oxidase [Balneola sp.]MBO6869157.1 pyridoxamine 5'-phosphate oxidase [Balneola sp.]
MDNKHIRKLREDYSLSTLDENDVNADPIEQFKIWLDESLKAMLPEPNAMTLSTVDSEQKPHSRIVLLKGIEKNGFIFYTNYKSDKGRDIESNPNVSICFLWKELERQVRIEGIAKKISSEASEEYFVSRPVKSQIGALASEQSSVIENRAILEEKFEALTKLYSTGHVPMPDHWGGYVVEPTSIEFWQGRRSRLHDRIKYEKEKKNWIIKRLAP